MTGATDPLLVAERKAFHAGLISSRTLAVSQSGVASNADGANKRSVEWAKAIADSLAAETGERLAGQSSGNSFEDAVAAYLSASFSCLEAFRPGPWTVRKVSSRSARGIFEYEQYEHLGELDSAVHADPTLRASLGNAYVIAPDVVVVREPLSDATINSTETVLDGTIARQSPLRRAVQSAPLLHAVISCKWTLRSDRAQNARTEALNLIRNRKGRVPHIVVVTAEPTLSRISSLAFGTGDIDCMYHFALYELEAAVRSSGDDDQVELFESLVTGRRLKDISDLPFDLAI